MTRFYFHLVEGDDRLADEEGIELPDLASAREEAERAAREVLADAIKAGLPSVPDAFVIADEAGRDIARIALADVLPKGLWR
jgi:hypothetical protein